MKVETVAKIAPFPPELNLDMSLKQRLDEHERLLARVRSIEEKFPTEDKGIHAEWKAAKAGLAKWRAMLKQTIDSETTKLKQMEPKTKEDLEKSIDLLEYRVKKAKDATEDAKFKSGITIEKAKMWRTLPC